MDKQKPITITDTQAGVLNTLRKRGYQPGATVDWSLVVGLPSKPSVDALIRKGLLRAQGAGRLVVVLPDAYAALDRHYGKE